MTRRPVFDPSRWLVVGGSLLLVTTAASGQTVIYVDDDATGADDGSSWTNAFSDLQDALDTAVANDQIWIPDGIYLPTVESDADPRSVTFQLVDGVELYGGFRGFETAIDQRITGDLDQDLDEDLITVNEVLGAPAAAGAGSPMPPGPAVGSVNVSLNALVTPCPPDVNGDGVINVLDLINLLLCFGQPAVPGCSPEDVNGDGTVNVLDLIDLLLAFGTTCP